MNRWYIDGVKDGWMDSQLNVNCSFEAFLIIKTFGFGEGGDKGGGDSVFKVAFPPLWSCTASL